MDETGDFEWVLRAANSPDGWPSEDLLPLVYDELRSLAETRMRGEAQSHTLQATALVHEAWLKLAAGGERTWADRAHFFRAAAQAMRRILVDRARSKGRIKRGDGGEVRLEREDGKNINVVTVLLSEEDRLYLSTVDVEKGNAE
jgi:RNA polymerase sigma factor (TIGR02999 family)